MDNRMASWKGMTEPLEVGDPVRIIRCVDEPAYVGTVTEVIEIVPAGTKVRRISTGKMGSLKDIGYVLKEPDNSSWSREYLYKLPPDFRDVLSRAEIKEFVAFADSPIEAYLNRKRLQIRDT